MNTSNFASANVKFIRNGEMRIVSLCSIEEAMNYVRDVVLKNNWMFISISRGVEYGNN